MPPNTDLVSHQPAQASQGSGNFYTRSLLAVQRTELRAIYSNQRMQTSTQHGVHNILSGSAQCAGLQSSAGQRRGHRGREEDAAVKAGNESVQGIHD